MRGLTCCSVLEFGSDHGVSPERRGPLAELVKPLVFTGCVRMKVQHTNDLGGTWKTPFRHDQDRGWRESRAWGPNP